MRFDIRQTTTYAYPVPVAGSQHTIRMQPVSRQTQRVIAASLAVVPAPEKRWDSVDFFGNATTFALVAEPHDTLKIITQARVDVERPAPPQSTPPWEEIPDAALAARALGPELPVHFVFATPLIPMLHQIGDYARVSFEKERPIVEVAADLARRIKTDFKYDATATDVTTPVLASFKARAGVCQDFAHIMIAGLRPLGIPAGYVSGYLRTEPPSGGVRLEGSDAMHAWVRIWCGAELGWIEFDPTNGIIVGNDHITLAIGRDYSDVSPTVGTLKSHGRHSLAISVDVTPS